mmetsp:Transcript_43421/g.122927  ORF Transcript_43421/g.122927 Transcript_43421/m.122927 type:complete len:230 (+) Transcript_43421:41-730(+)
MSSSTVAHSSITDRAADSIVSPLSTAMDTRLCNAFATLPSIFSLLAFRVATSSASATFMSCCLAPCFLTMSDAATTSSTTSPRCSASAKGPERAARVVPTSSLSPNVTIAFSSASVATCASYCHCRSTASIALPSSCPLSWRAATSPVKTVAAASLKLRPSSSAASPTNALNLALTTPSTAWTSERCKAALLSKASSSRKRTDPRNSSHPPRMNSFTTRNIKWARVMAR